MKTVLALIFFILAWPLGMFIVTNYFVRAISFSGYDGMRFFYDSTTPDEEKQAIYNKVKKRERITFLITAIIAFPLEYYWLTYLYSKLPF